MGLGLLLFPALTSALLLMVFRKTGLSMAWTFMGLLPLIGAALPIVVLSLAEAGRLDISPPIYSFVPLTSALLSLLPIAILAFVRWPDLADKSTSRR
jgi:hypothetical protein